MWFSLFHYIYYITISLKGLIDAFIEFNGGFNSSIIDCSKHVPSDNRFISFSCNFVNVKLSHPPWLRIYTYNLHQYNLPTLFFTFFLWWLLRLDKFNVGILLDKGHFKILKSNDNTDYSQWEEHKFANLENIPGEIISCSNDPV